MCVFPNETTFRCACILYNHFTSESLLPYYSASDSIHSVLCVLLVSSSSKYMKMEFCKFVSVFRVNSRGKHCDCRRRFEGHRSLSSCPVSLRLQLKQSGSTGSGGPRWPEVLQKKEYGHVRCIVSLHLKKIPYSQIFWSLLYLFLHSLNNLITKKLSPGLSFLAFHQNDLGRQTWPVVCLLIGE